MQNQIELAWLNLNSRLNAKGNIKQEYQKLENYYSKSGRKYHTMKHIEHCLRELNEVKHLATNPDAVEYALILHDVADTEEESARIALETMIGTSLSSSFMVTVICLILATKHTIAFEDYDMQLIMDIDLSILGQSENIFDRYETEISQEYDWVKPRELFFEGRLKIIDYFIRRIPLYGTAYFREKYEVQAKRNLARSIAKLYAARQSIKD